MNNRLIATSIFFSASVLTLGPVSQIFAQTQSPAATSSSDVDSEEVKESIKERIRSAVENSTTELISLDSAVLRGWLGTIESVTNQTLTLSVDGVSELISVNDATQVFDEDAETVDLETLGIGTAVMIYGSAGDREIISADRIEALEELPAFSTKMSVLATISEIDTRLDELTLITLPSNQTLTMSLTRSSVLLDGFNSEEEIELEDLTENDQILVVYQADEEDPEDISLLQLVRVSSAPEDDLLQDATDSAIAQ